ncbi:MAG: S8 family serine peptidase [Elusimicrobiaceae bacterium]
MRNIFKLIFAAFLAVGVAHAEGGVGKIVMFRDNVRADVRGNFVKNFNGKLKTDLPLINAVVVEIPAGTEAAFDRAMRERANDIYYIEDDITLNWLNSVSELDVAAFKKDLKESKIETPVVNELEPELVMDSRAAAALPWGITRVKANKVWARNTGRGVKVGIVDTGVDLDHPNLKANIVASFNAITPNTTGDDDNGHGTHVAGTIAGVLNGPNGVTGVAPEAKIYAAKVLSASGSGSLSSVVSGIQWVVSQKVSVINMSLGSPQGSEAIAKAVKAAKAAGVTVVCAAGNDSGPVNYPAAYPESVAIAASDSSDKITSFSSRGPQIAFIAPGKDIPSTFKDGGYRTLSGTSMASPHVAGLAVLAVAAGAKTPEQVIAKLKAASVKLNLQPTEQGNGLIQADKISAKK